jgi:HD-GYP domain-containing protein (c-di-GMP phosphodiesterase class II)
MLRRLLLAQALVVTAVVSGLTVSHFVVAPGHPVAGDLAFMAGLGLLAVVLLTSITVVRRGIERVLSERDESHLGTVTSLAAAIDASDRYTGTHSHAVTALVRLVGRDLGLARDRLRDLELAAALHDVGKIGVPAEILQKPGPLDPHEMAVLRRHPEIGARILAGVPRADVIREAVLHEHEHWDGSGYPAGLAGDRIPLISRIVLACDAYHAMTSDRPYRRALHPEEAHRRLAAGSGSQFDPTVVASLMRCLSVVAPTAVVAPAPVAAPAPAAAPVPGLVRSALLEDALA